MIIIFCIIGNRGTSKEFVPILCEVLLNIVCFFVDSL
jgi:hypothetical protein